MRALVFLAAALLATPAVAKPIRTLDGRTLSATAIDADVARMMAATKTTGLGVALIRGGRVVFVKSYGQRDVTRKLPLTPDTVMYGASLTKATFAVYVMTLVDDGRIDLDRPIAAYLPKPLPEYPAYADLKDDPRWRTLTLRMLLNHTSGFANFRWIDPDGKLRFHRDPGTRYGYSGEGINLAQFVLQTGLGIDLGKEMQARLFARLGMTRTSLTWRPDFAGNLAQGYTAEGAEVAHHGRGNVRAAGSMDTTLADWSRFLAAAARGDLLSRKARRDMIRSTIAIDSPAQFPTLLDARTDQWRKIGLGYGVGWGGFDTHFGRAFFKEGHDDQTANYALCVDARRDCILLLSNDVRAEAMFLPLVERLLGPVGLPWEWENYPPYDLPK